MKIDEFMQVTKEIENFYQKEMTEEQKKIWFENLKSMDIKRFSYLVSLAYKTYKFIPKLADIMELNINTGVRIKNNSEPIQNCKKCNNTGYVLYTKLVDNGIGGKLHYEYMAVCDCGRQKQYKGWEFPDERYRTNYYTPMANELGL